MLKLVRFGALQSDLEELNRHAVDSVADILSFIVTNQVRPDVETQIQL